MFTVTFAPHDVHQYTFNELIELDNAFPSLAAAVTSIVPNDEPMLNWSSYGEFVTYIMENSHDVCMGDDCYTVYPFDDTAYWTPVIDTEYNPFADCYNVDDIPF